MGRAGFLPPNSPTFDELSRNADADLFWSISSNPDHVFRHYFHEKPTDHNLRPRAHSFALPSKDPWNFVSRTLYGSGSQPVIRGHLPGGP